MFRFAEILAGIAEEEHQTKGLTVKELWLPLNRKRIGLVIALQVGVQLTGNTSLAYCKRFYSPTKKSRY